MRYIDGQTSKIEFRRARLQVKSTRSLIIICCLLVAVGMAQTNNPDTKTIRPFQAKVEALSKETLTEQRRSIVELNRTLMEEDYAIITGKRDVPNFGHLARELATQQKFEVMRALLKGRELKPYNYYTIAELLATNFDAEAFDLLVTNSSLTMPPPKSDQTWKEGNDIISGEGIPEYSALSLSHYLGIEAFREKAETHLISILRHHKRTGVRAFAALALGDSKSPKVIKPLEAAVADKARVLCSQCGEDYVGQYAEEALKKIKQGP